MPNIAEYGGYAAPKGITGTAEIKKLQKTLDVPVDGVWGPISQKAYSDYLKKFNEPMTARYQVEGYSAPGMVRHQQDVRRMQELLGVSADGIWGPETDKAYRQRMAQESGAVAPTRANADKSNAIAESLKRIAASAAATPSIDSAAARSYTGSGNTPQNRKALDMMMREDARAGSAQKTPIARDIGASRSSAGTSRTLSLMMREDARAGGASLTPIAHAIKDVRPGKDESDERNRLMQEDIEAGGK